MKNKKTFEAAELAWIKLNELYKKRCEKGWVNFIWFIDKEKKLKKEINELIEAIFQEPTFTIKFMAEYSDYDEVRVRVPKETLLIEKARKTILKNPKTASYYAHHFVRQRWKEAEPIILKGNPSNIIGYYENCRLCEEDWDIWEEAEPIFAKKTAIFHRYVLITLNPNKNYEQQILKNPNNKNHTKYAYEYSCKVLKKRWKEAEPIIFKDTEYSARYCTKFGLSLPEEVHNQIVAEVVFDKNSKHKKKYLEEESKKKEVMIEYLKSLVEKKVITKKTTVNQLFELK